MIMSTAQASAESIRAVLSSPSTCTASTPTILSELLIPSKITSQNENLPPIKPPITTSKSKAAKGPATKPRARKAGQDGLHENGAGLPPKEAFTLATEVVNATLKYLGDAVKAPAQISVRRQASSKDLVKAAGRKTLRRSNSLPQSPLQPRSLNRVISSPNIRYSRSSSTASNSTIIHRPMAECARVGFAALRSLQASPTADINLPPMQLESGMSVLIAKFLALGFEDLALKELRLLKRRLECGETSKPAKVTKTATASPVPTLADLLDFGAVEPSGVKLGLTITTQMQILQLMTLCRKSKQVEDALPLLKLNHPTSPLKLILLAAEENATIKQREKHARQMERLSGLLLSLCPSLSTADDALALEPRLSVSPEVAIQIQTLALHSRYLWWSLANHQGDLSKDIYEPFLRCLSTFSRRSHCGTSQTCSIAIEVTETVLNFMTNCAKPQSQPLKLALGGIYQLLGSLSRGAHRIEDAIKWTKRRQDLSDRRADSDTKRTSLSATLVGLILRQSSPHAECEELLFTLLEELDKPFKGESSEIEELLKEVSAARRSAIGVLNQFRESSGAGAPANLNDGIRQMCETLVFLCPRLALRYLGNIPDAKSTVKDAVRYEQRRQFINMISIHSIDSALHLVKLLVGLDQIAWDLFDSKLQDCLLLLDKLEPYDKSSVSDDNGSSACYIRISNLYFTQFLNMQRQPDAKQGQLMRAVRRSIDCIRIRPKQEKKSAHLIMKLERMAGFCKASERYDEVYQTLLWMRDEMIEDGFLLPIVDDASSKPFDAIWAESDQSRMLGRNLETLLRVDLKYLEPAAPRKLIEETWSKCEQAAVLEYQLELLCKRFNESELVMKLQCKIISDLLEIYDEQQYPLRRTRVFIKFLSRDLDRTEVGSKLLSNHLDFLGAPEIVIKDTLDEGLQNYLVHYKHLVSILLQLRQQQPDLDVFRQALSSWSASRKRCESLAALGQEIDDVPGLLVQLQMTSDFLNMKGHGSLALASMQLKVEINQLCENLIDPDDVVMGFVGLGGQWLHLGYTGKAGLALDKATTQCTRHGITAYAKLHCKLTYCEYLLSLGSHDKAQETLNSAQDLYSSTIAHPSEASPLITPEQIKMDVLVSQAYIMHSMLAYERGAAHNALSEAKQGVKILRRTWAVIEKQGRKRICQSTGTLQKDVEKVTEELSQLNISTMSIAAAQCSEEIFAASSLWCLVPSLFRGLNHLSLLYAHHGMSQEMIYYAEQAHKVAKMANSEACLAMASINLGSAWLRCGVLEKGSEFLMKASKLCITKRAGREGAVLSYHQGIMHGLLGDSDSEMDAFDAAEKILRSIVKTDFIEMLDKLIACPESLNQKKSGLTTIKLKAKTVAVRKTTTRSKLNLKTKLATRAHSPEDSVHSISEECRQITSFLATVLRRKAQSLMTGRSEATVDAILEETARYTHTQIDTIHQGLATAKQCLLDSIEKMNADPVYSVLQDSTISFPSTVQSKSDKVGDRLSVVKVSPPQKIQIRGNKDRQGTRSPVPGSFSDRLREAHELLTNIHSTAVHIAPLPVINKVSALLNSVSILLSAVGQGKGRSLASPGLASSSVENARTLALRRARKAILLEPYASLKPNDMSWPQAASRNSRRSSIALPCDMFRFQKEYIDIIPKSWTVVSISLGDSDQELCVSRLQAGLTPFILRLPLGRHNSMDADEEVFGFEQGRSELMEILALANESSHEAATRTSREDKIAWWDEREALDARLRDLLENVEKVWLGGFTGIFSQHTRRSDLLARFQKSFSNILDRHLPSRRKTGRRNVSPRVTLDTRILDLFIGLGDASDEDCDLSEPLADLLNFVVDVLQFHGELNAYAEIDFDSIVVETHDALRSYHVAVRSAGLTDGGHHTILVLDKALHSLPWESLPCMDGLSVSRVPSLGCLRDRILEQQDSTIVRVAPGHYVSRDRVSYILNPAGDLKNTQITFQKSLERPENWQGITNRAPSEEEFKEQLTSKDMLLYFGHGSGAQYIRAREIRKLEKCAVTVLMGCSSGALTEAGEFEPYGPPINYMHAGCPALVATLWDVTDKDIDRFAKSTFEYWGLLEAEPQGRGKNKKRVEETRQNVSLTEAVAKSRSACNLRYLNGASVCIYGVPVYLA